MSKAHALMLFVYSEIDDGVFGGKTCIDKGSGRINVRRLLVKNAVLVKQTGGLF